MGKIGKFEQLSFASKDFQFPDGTQQTTLWSFDLFHKSQLVCDFEWIDYRGGILDDVFDPDLEADARKKQQVDELLGHISLSNAVLLFADSIVLTSYTNPYERALHTGARVINNLLRLYSLHYPTRSLNIIIMLTKADSDVLDNKWKQYDFAPLIEVGLETFGEVVSLVNFNRERWTGGIVAVGAVGEGNTKSTLEKPADFKKPIMVETKITGYPNPINAYHPLFFCVGQTLAKMKETAEVNAFYYEKEYFDALSKSSMLMDFWSAVTETTNPRSVAEIFSRKRMQEIETLKKISSYINPLYHTALKKVKMI